MYRIVIIDDEPWVGAVLMENIDWSRLGFQIAGLYTHPGEALKSICEINPEIVITDISMPMINGLDLIKRAKMDGCTSRFVILTAYKDFDYAKQAISLDVEDYCLKPIEINETLMLFHRLKDKLDAEHVDETEEFPATRFDEILEYIHTHMNEHLSLQDISDRFYINRNYICNLFKKHQNTTFSQYLTEKRLSRAKYLLTGTGLSLAEIADKVGFKDEFYFNKVFKKSESISPGLYRKLNKI
jgi:two-component system response regulator YesN